jgi:hypothetical protein
VTVASALTLAGCTASDAAVEGAKPTPSAPAAAAGAQSSPTTDPAARTDAAEVTDTDTCAAISDVLTIQFNAEAALRDGRMQAQEQQAWNRLATRVFDRAPTSGETVLSQAVADLQASIPDSPPGALGTTLIGTDEWLAAFPTIIQLCAQAGAEVVTEGFVGG